VRRRLLDQQWRASIENGRRPESSSTLSSDTLAPSF
jgi:hypothetical protein